MSQISKHTEKDTFRKQGTLLNNSKVKSWTDSIQENRCQLLSLCTVTYTGVTSRWQVVSLNFTIREECRVFQNRILRRIFEPKKNDNVEWRRLHNEKLSSLYRLPNILRVVKSRRIRWAGHVASEVGWVLWCRDVLLIESHPFCTTFDLQLSFYCPLC